MLSICVSPQGLGTQSAVARQLVSQSVSQSVVDIYHCITPHDGYLLAEMTDDDDDVLLIMAEELGRLVPAVGGGEHAHGLFLPLERLLTVEEVTVRDKAVESTQAVAQAMSDEAVGDHLVPVLRRLVGRDWFTSRISAAALVPGVLPRLPAAGREELL